MAESTVTNVLSIDVEDWYHGLETDPGTWDEYEDRVIDATRTILKILAAGKTRATFFVLGDVARKHPQLVKEIHEAGHEVGSHGPDHQFVYNKTPEQFETEMAADLELLEAITGQKVQSYRAPYFSITKESLWALPILKKLGIKYDSSIFPISNYRYGIPTAPRKPWITDEGLVEVPVATYPLGPKNFPCGGGFYFRFFTYRVLRHFYYSLNNHGEQFCFYLHPWEVDPDHPLLDCARGMKMRHYWALHKTTARLTKMIHDFDFGPLKEVIKL